MFEVLKTKLLAYRTQFTIVLILIGDRDEMQKHKSCQDTISLTELSSGRRSHSMMSQKYEFVFLKCKDIDSTVSERLDT